MISYEKNVYEYLLKTGVYGQWNSGIKISVLCRDVSPICRV
jgi:hypothetical protein